MENDGNLGAATMFMFEKKLYPKQPSIVSENTNMHIGMVTPVSRVDELMEEINSMKEEQLVMYRYINRVSEQLGQLIEVVGTLAKNTL